MGPLVDLFNKWYIQRPAKESKIGEVFSLKRRYSSSYCIQPLVNGKIHDSV